MMVMDSLFERRLEELGVPLGLVLPDGQRIGPGGAAVTIRLKQLGPLAHRGWRGRQGGAGLRRGSA